MFWVGEVEAAASASGADVAKFGMDVGFIFFLLLFLA